MGLLPVPAVRRDDLLWRPGRRSARDLRFPAGAGADGPAVHAPHADVLDRVGRHRRRDGVRRLLRRVSLRHAAWPRRGGRGRCCPAARERGRLAPPRAGGPPRVSALLWVAFALSGAGALGLELLWLRWGGLVLGTTPATAATVLASYFAGLAVGGVLARRPAARPVRRYAALELAGAAG